MTAQAIKILVVDDEPMIRNFLRTGLRYEGFDVAEAGGGEEALALAGRFQPDLVIIDVMMPGLDGHEVCRRLRGDPDLGIQAILRRLRPTAGPSLEAGPLRLDPVFHQAFLGDRPVDLTAREFDLLKLFVQHPKQALSRQTILDRVWGGDFFGGENKVEVYVGYLRRKLHEHCGRLIQTVRGVGYRLVP